MYDCSCDYGDPPTVYSKRVYRAKKAYKCEECAGPISPGEQYEYVFAIWDGYDSQIKTCQHCVDIRTWVKNNVPCLCIMHGNQDEENEMAISAAYERAPSEVVGLRFGYLRRKAMRDKFNRAARGGARG